MFDIRAVRDDPAAFDFAMARRGLAPPSARLLALDRARRGRIAETQAIRTERNAASKRIGAARARGEDTAEPIARVAALRHRLREGEDAVRALGRRNRGSDAGATQRAGPGRPPTAPDETANVEVRRVGEPRAFDFPPRHHFEIGEALGADGLRARGAPLRGALRGAGRAARAAAPGARANKKK